MELLYVWACAPNSYLNIFDKVQEVEHRIADPTLCVSWTNSVLYFINILMFVSNKIQPPPPYTPCHPPLPPSLPWKQKIFGLLVFSGGIK